MDKKMQEITDKGFNETILNNPMFDEYDKNIIKNHIGNFFCVFELGVEEGRRQGKKDLWNHIQNIQMGTYESKPFLSGYLCLSHKQCDDITKLLEG